MGYDEMLHSMLCRNCYDGPGWWNEIVSGTPGEDIGEEGRKPPMLCVESWYADYEEEQSSIITREFYYRLWCRKCLPASLQ